MRSLRFLINKKKPLVVRDTGFITLANNNNFTNNISINSSVVFRNLPNSPIGLTEGSVWRDGDGILRVV